MEHLILLLLGFFCYGQIQEIHGRREFRLEVVPHAGQMHYPEGANIYIQCSVIGLRPWDEATIEWSDPDGNTVSVLGDRVFVVKEPTFTSLHIQSLVETDVGQYTCSAEAHGTKLTAIKHISMFKDITFVEYSRSKTFEAGSDGFITCNVTGAPQPTVSWRKDGRRIRTGGKFVKQPGGLAIHDITSADAGQYVCRAEVVKDGRLKEVRIPVTVTGGTITPLPFKDIEFVEYSSSKSFEAGSDGFITCKVTGVPQPTVSWRKDGRRIRTGAKFSQQPGGLAIHDITSADAGQYVCRAEVAQDGRLKEVHIPVTVTGGTTTPLPFKDIEFVEYPSSKSFEAGSDGFITCRVTGVPQPTVSWRKDGRWLAMGTKFSQQPTGLTINDITSDDAGRYVCRAEVEQYGRLKEVSIQVTVSGGITTPPPFKEIEFVEYPSSKTFKAGSDGFITCKVTGEPQPTVSWKKDGRWLTMGTKFSQQPTGLSIHDITSADAGQYVCRAEMEQHGFFKQVAIEVTVTDGTMEPRSAPSAPTIPGAPSDIMVTKSTPTSVRFAVHAPASDGGSPITMYRIEYDRMVQTFNIKNTNNSGEWVVLDVKDLLPATAYLFRISAGNNMGMGSALIYRHTTEAIQNPGEVTITSDSKGQDPYSYTAEWTESDDGGLLLTHFNIRYRQVKVKEGTDELEQVLSYWISIRKDLTFGDLSSTYSYRITNLSADSSYQLQVVAYNDIGSSRPNDQFIFKTAVAIGTTASPPRPVPPSRPGELRDVHVTKSTPTSVSIAFHAPRRGSPINTYRIEYEGMVHQFMVENTNQSDEWVHYNVENLRPSTSYTFRILAVNKLGIGPPATLIYSTKSISYPGPVTITSDPEGQEPYSYTAEWTVPDDGGSPLTTFVMRIREVEVKEGTNEIVRIKGAWRTTWRYLTADDLSTSYSYQFEYLNSDSAYQLHINAKNDLGASRPNDLFIFTTAVANSTTTAMPSTRDSEAATVEVTLHPNDPEVVRSVGASFVLMCQVTNLTMDQVPSITWLVNSNEVMGHTTRIFEELTNTTSKLYIFEAEAEDSGEYVCEVKDGETTTNKTVTVAIRKELSIDHAPPSQMIWSGGDDLIECTASGETEPDVWWMKDGQTIHPGSKYQFESDGLLVFNVSSSDAGLYTCIAEDVEEGFVKDAFISVIVR